MDDKYATGQKGLNTSGGTNRFKFEGKRARAKRVDVDVAHKVRADGFLDADKAQAPEAEGGSFFQQELDRSKELNVTPPFKRFYYKAWPLVQSLPEVVHHAPSVVDMLLALLTDPVVSIQAGEEALQLMSVLGRDLQGSFFPFFPRVSTVLVGLIAPPDVAPEVCGRVLRCLGFLMKFVARPLSKDMSSVRATYAPLLGHTRDFARKMAAQSLAPAVRRLKPKAMRRHAKQLVAALASGAVAAGADDAAGGARLRADTLDGCSQLLFFVAKGVHGRTHSQAPVLLRVLLDSLLPAKPPSQDPSDVTEQRDDNHDHRERRNQELERGWCFELASAVLALLVEHVRSPHSAELWLELHYGLGTATTRHRAALKSLAPGSGGTHDGDEGEGAECAAVRRSTDLLSQAVGHMGGILLREEAIGVKQAALLAEVLVELTTPDVFWQSGTSPACRRAVVELLSVALCGLHKQQRLVKVMPRVISAAAAAPTGSGGKGQGALTVARDLGGALDAHPVLALSRSLLGGVGAERTENKPPPMRVTRAVALPPLLEACAGPLTLHADVALEVLMRVIHGTGVGLLFWGDKVGRRKGGKLQEGSDDEQADELYDEGEREIGALVRVGGVAGAGELPIGLAAGEKLAGMCCDCIEAATVSLRRGYSTSAKSRSLPSEVRIALAALRCLPCVVGSFARTKGARRTATEKPLALMEDLLRVLDDYPGDSTADSEKTDKGRRSPASKRDQERNEAARGEPKNAHGFSVEKERGTCGGSVVNEVAVVRAHVVEAGVGLCCLRPAERSNDSTAGREDNLKRLTVWLKRALTWLDADPASIATLRASARLLRTIRATPGVYGEDIPCISSDAALPVMALLESNLASESRLLRLATLRVLARFDPLKFEDDTGRLQGHREGSSTVLRENGGRDGACNFLEVAEALETLPISVAAERDLMWRLGQLEVLARSGRLPRPYAQLMATHALGLLRVKFSGVWPRATAIIAALCQRSHQRELVWRPMLEALRKVMPPPPTRQLHTGALSRRPAGAPGQQTSVAGDNGSAPVSGMANGSKSTTAPESTQQSSSGNDREGDTRVDGSGPSLTAGSLEQLHSVSLRVTTPPPLPWVPRLLPQAAALDAGPTEEMDLPVALAGVFLDEPVRTGLQPESGEVPLWASTDADSTFAQVWGALSQCPELLQQHSRTVVPLFLGFLQYQYLGDRAFPDDSETRAVEIASHLTPLEQASEGPGGWGPVVKRGDGRQSAITESAERTADRRSVRGRLGALLEVFSAASGPKSLYKQRVLFRVYRALLVMPDEKIAGLALRCMLSYKPPFLVPYKAHLEGLMNDETLRDELVTFSLRSESGSSASLADALGTGVSESGPAIDALHRPCLIPVVIRLVYGRLSASGGRASGHGGPAARRAAVLAFLSSLSSEELVELFALMIRPFVPTTESDTASASTEESWKRRDEGPAEWDDVTGQTLRAREVLDIAAGVGASGRHLGRVPASRQAGFLKMVKEVARQLGQRALPYVEILLGLVLALLEYSNIVSEHERIARSGQSVSTLADDDMMEDEEMIDAGEDEHNLNSLDLTTSSTNAAGPSSSTGSLARSSKGRIAPGALRALCLRALSELFSQYSASFDFAAHQEALWPALADPIARLPASTVGAVRAPALLTFAETLTESEALLPLFSSTSGKGGEALVPAVLDCISAGSAGGRVAGPVVIGSALTCVQRLLLYNEGSLLVPHLNRLISNFAARLSVSGDSGKGIGSGGALDSHTERGLTILARVAEMATSGLFENSSDNSGAVDASSMSKLIVLLIPSLQPDRRATDEAKSSILCTVGALARRVDPAGARRAWTSLSRLLGPAGARPSGMAAAAPRGELVRALEALACRPDLAASSGRAVSLVTELNAQDAVALDEPDFARVVPAYNSLSEGSGWEDVITAGGNAGEAGTEDMVTALGGMLAAAPVAQHCLHCMHNQEVALRGAAGAALKRLVREVSVREKTSAAGGDERCSWEGLMRTVVMPGLRAGMACRTEIVRKGYIALLRETVSMYQESAAESIGEGSKEGDTGIDKGGSASVVPSDLWVLARADDPESDFFLNACHMQVHRRARALAKARKAIEESEAAAAIGNDLRGGDGREDPRGHKSPASLPAACPFRVSTLVHFLLPLALHPLHEAAKSAEAGLVGQAVLLAGAVARHLPWTHYNSALRGLMQQVGGSGSGDTADSPEKERAMIGAICQVLDGFHFALAPPPVDNKTAENRLKANAGAVANGGETLAKVEGEAAADVEKAGKEGPGGDAVWRAVNGRLLGSLQGLLTKEVRAKNGGKDKLLRAPIALGMLNLVRRLPAEVFKLKLQPLLMTVCQSLKSRDSNARDTARDTLAKMAKELGPEYLQQIITELRTCLVTGYQLHVRTFTLHTVLKTVADSYVPPNPPSIDIRSMATSEPASTTAPAAAESTEMDADGGTEASGSTLATVPAVLSSLVRPSFDACIAEIAELLMDDLFGESAIAKEAQGANVASSKMKEAKGQKAYDSFEITARTMLFRPTFSVLSPEDAASVSSVHALVGPVLKKLERCENPREVGKAHEALTRIGMGLAANPSVTESEMLLYVHATVAPFLLPQISEEEDEDDDDVEERDSDDSSDSDAEEGLGVGPARKKGKGRAGVASKTRKWNASEANIKGQSRGSAAGDKRRREWESVQVIDGASAPKHTGRDRHDGRAAGRLRPGGPSSLTHRQGSGKGVDLADPAALGAVTVALGLLHSRLKAEATARGGRRATAMDRKGEMVRAMADPFVPLLTRCIGKNPHTPVVLLSLKSLGYFLHWNLPSVTRCAPLVGRHVLARLVRGGVGGIRGEMGQACFKTLSMLFKSQIHVFGVSTEEQGLEESGREGAGGARTGKKKGRGGNLFGLSTKQLRALLVVLQMAVAETEHQNATFTLIKAVVSRRVMLPEVYDLMTKLADLAVTSHRPTLRATAGQTFLTFLLQYPLGEKRLQFHLNQIISGVSYEHAEGRLAALTLCTQLTKRLPEPNLDQLSSVLYLALVVRLVSDGAAECRAAASIATDALLSRVSGAVFHQLLDLTREWFGSMGLEDDDGNGESNESMEGVHSIGGGERNPALKRTAAQACGIFVQARPELVRKGAGKRLPWLLSALTSMLPRRAADVIIAARNSGWGDAGGPAAIGGGGDGVGADSAGADDWEGVYHAVLSVGKIFDALPGACNAALSAKGDDGDDGGSAGNGPSGDDRVAATDPSDKLFDRLLEALLYPHAWVRLAAARVWGSFFSKRDPGSLAVGSGGGKAKQRVGHAEQGAGKTGGGKGEAGAVVKDGGQEFLRRRRVLFRLCQNFCSQLNRSQVDPNLTEQCVKNLVFLGRAMHLNPDLCFAEDTGAGEGSDSDSDAAADTDGDDEMENSDAEKAAQEREGKGDATEISTDLDRVEKDVTDGGTAAAKVLGEKQAADPLRWVFNRMAHMVVHKGEARRRAVFSWFGAMVAVHEPALFRPHLNLMLLPLRRAVLDAESGGVEPKARVSMVAGRNAAGLDGGPGKEQTSAELATEVMELLETKVGSGLFLESLTAVNMEISRKRVERKRQRAVEKATNPVAAAERRRERTEAGKLQKRRKVEESAKLRGGTKRMRMGSMGMTDPKTSGRGGGRQSRGRGGGRGMGRGFSRGGGGGGRGRGRSAGDRGRGRGRGRGRR